MSDVTHTPTPIIAADKDDPYVLPAWAVYDVDNRGTYVDIYGLDTGYITLTASDLDQLAIAWIQHRLHKEA